MIKKNELRKILKSTIEIAEDVGEFQRKYFRKKINIREKIGAGLVTEIDFRSEEKIVKKFKKQYPHIAIIGEEYGSSGTNQTSELTWHIDPLDGTTNYAHGFPMYAVSIGLAFQNKAILGVVHASSLRDTWWGAQQLGAYQNKSKIFVSKRKQMKEALLATGFAYMKGKPLQNAVERFRQVSLQARAVRRPGAASLDLAFLASGVYDGFWERDLKSWDMCAGVALVEEAGGRVTNFSNGKFDLYSGEILGSNQILHPKMVNLLVL